MRTERIVVDGFGYRVRTAGRGPALVLLHGFTGGGEAWSPFLPAFARRWRVVVPDLPGHGGTDVPADSFSMEVCADHLSGILDRLHVRRAVVVGYSLGGRTALTWALRHPERVRGLVLESASPGIDSTSERAQRREQDEALAKFIEEEGVAAFVDRWERLPLFASQTGLPEQVREEIRRRRLGNSPPGLAGSLRTMGAGVMEPLQGKLASLSMPTLLLAGSLDEKYCSLAETTGALLPDASVDIVEGAGHAIHIERPGEWLRRVETFLHIIRTESGDLFGHSVEVGG